MSSIEKFNSQTREEEIGNMLTHGAGTVLAIYGTYLLISRALASHDVLNVVSACVFGGSLIVLYLMSTLYHSMTSVKVKKVLQVFDHCSIFVLILGTYTPFCLVTLRSTAGYLLFGMNALLTIIGLTLNIINVKKYHKLSLVFYLLMGWSIVFAIKPAMASIPFRGLMMLLAGGLSYTFGVIFYKAEKMKFSHVIWHFFVLAGSILHFLCIYSYVI